MEYFKGNQFEISAEGPTGSVEKFRDEYFFLSNMQPLEVGIDTEFGPAATAEHVYQMAKFTDQSIRRAVFEAPDGFIAKRTARRFKDSIRPEWNDDLKILAMRNITEEKFRRNPNLAMLLLATKDKEIVEGNPRNDKFWGVSPVGSRDGQNHLGRILMNLRERLLLEQHFETPPGKD